MHKLFALFLSLAVTAGITDVAAEDGIFVFGGTRGVGLEIVKLLSASDQPVTVLVRSTSDLTGLSETNAQTVVGDAMDKATIAEALESGRFQAAISTLSGNQESGFTVDSVGNINAIDASLAAGISRFILVSSIGVGDSAAGLPPPALEALEAVLAEKAKAEVHLAATDMRYTIIRPGALMNKPASGDGVLTEDSSVGGVIARAELASLIIAALEDPQTERKTLSAIQ